LLYLVSLILIILTTVVIGFVSIKTIQECMSEKICIEEE